MSQIFNYKVRLNKQILYNEIYMANRNVFVTIFVMRLQYDDYDSVFLHFLVQNNPLMTSVPLT